MMLCSLSEAFCKNDWSLTCASADNEWDINRSREFTCPVLIDCLQCYRKLVCWDKQQNIEISILTTGGDCHNFRYYCSSIYRKIIIMMLNGRGGFVLHIICCDGSLSSLFPFPLCTYILCIHSIFSECSCRIIRWTPWDLHIAPLRVHSHINIRRGSRN